MAEIDSININNVKYDITLPSTANPSISSLTTSSLTVNGTANLSVIKGIAGTSKNELSIECASTLDIRAKSGIDIYHSTNSAEKAHISFTNGATGPTFSIFTGCGTSLAISPEDVNTGGRRIQAPSICKDQYNICTLPSKSGTLATLSDIPRDKMYLHIIDAKIKANDGLFDVYMYFSCYVFSTVDKNVQNTDELKTLLVEASNSDNNHGIPCHMQYRDGMGRTFMGYFCYADYDQLKFKSFQADTLSAPSSSYVPLDREATTLWSTVLWVEADSQDYVIALACF